jgi:hypothetical protein
MAVKGTMSDEIIKMETNLANVLQQHELEYM